MSVSRLLKLSRDMTCSLAKGNQKCGKDSDHHKNIAASVEDGHDANLTLSEGLTKGLSGQIEEGVLRQGRGEFLQAGWSRMANTEPASEAERENTQGRAHSAPRRTAAGQPRVISLTATALIDQAKAVAMMRLIPAGEVLERHLGNSGVAVSVSMAVRSAQRPSPESTGARGAPIRRRWLSSPPPPRRHQAPGNRAV